MTERTVIAQIPTGQPIDLFTAVGGLLDAALGGALLGPGDGLAVAGTVVLRDDLSIREAIGRLRTAAGLLAEAMPQTPITDVPDEVEAGTVGPITADPDGGLTFQAGGLGELGDEMMRTLLAAVIPAMDEAGAPNYLEVPAFDPESGKRYALIFVRPGGLTPHQLRQQAEAEVKQLRAQLAKLEGADRG